MDSSQNNNTLLSELNNHKITEFVPVIMFIVFVMTFGILGNLSVITYYGFKAKNTTTNLFIVALAIIDLMTCLYFCVEIVELCYSVTFRSSFGCKVMNFIYRCLLYTSGCFLVLIGLDRYRIICRQKMLKVTSRSAKVVILACSVFCCLLSTKDLFVSDTITVNLTITDYNQSVTGYYCTKSNDKDMKSIVDATQTIDLVVFLIIISSLIIIYSFVAKEVCRYRNKRSAFASKPGTSTNAELESEMSVISSKATNAKYNSPLSDPTIETEIPKPSSSGAPSDSKDVRKNYTDIVNTSSNNIIDITNNECEQNHIQARTNSNDSTTLSRSEKSLGQGHSKKIERNITVMMIVMTTASILSYVPHFILDLLLKNSMSGTRYHQEFSAGLQIIWRSFILNSAINPYIMGLFNTKFRKFVKSIVCKCFAGKFCAKRNV